MQSYLTCMEKKKGCHCALLPAHIDELVEEHSAVPLFSLVFTALWLHRYSSSKQCFLDMQLHHHQNFSWFINAMKHNHCCLSCCTADCGCDCETKRTLPHPHEQKPKYTVIIQQTYLVIYSAGVLAKDVNI